MYFPMEHGVSKVRLDETSNPFEANLQDGEPTSSEYCPERQFEQMDAVTFTNVPAAQTFSNVDPSLSATPALAR